MLRSKNNGYILETTYDRESWNVVDSVLAKKTFDDGSWDMINGGSEKVVLDKFVPETYFSVKLNVGGTIFESRHLKTEEEAIRVEQRFRETTLG